MPDPCVRLACGRVFRGGRFDATSFLLSNWVKKHVSLFLECTAAIQRTFPLSRACTISRTMMVLSGRDDERHLVLENYHHPPRSHSHWALNGVCLLWGGMYTKWEFGCNSVEPDPAFSNNVYSVVKFIELFVVVFGYFGNLLTRVLTFNWKNVLWINYSC